MNRMIAFDEPQYDYDDEFVGIAPGPKTPADFIITVRKKGSMAALPFGRCYPRRS